MFKRIIILVMVFSLCIPAVAFCENKLLMENDNVFLYQRGEGEDLMYTLEIMSDNQQAELIFYSTKFALKMNIDVITVDENQQSRVVFKVGDETLGYVTMSNLFAQSLFYSTDQQAEVAIFERMRDNQEVLYVTAECEGSGVTTFSFNLASFLPVCNEFFKLISQS